MRLFTLMCLSLGLCLVSFEGYSRGRNGPFSNLASIDESARSVRMSPSQFVVQLKSSAATWKQNIQSFERALNKSLQSQMRASARVQASSESMRLVLVEVDSPDLGNAQSFGEPEKKVLNIIQAENSVLSAEPNALFEIDLQDVGDQGSEVFPLFSPSLRGASENSSSGVKLAILASGVARAPKHWRETWILRKEAREFSLDEEQSLNPSDRLGLSHALLSVVLGAHSEGEEIGFQILPIAVASSEWSTTLYRLLLGLEVAQKNQVQVVLFPWLSVWESSLLKESVLSLQKAGAVFVLPLGHPRMGDGLPAHYDPLFPSHWPLPRQIRVLGALPGAQKVSHSNYSDELGDFLAPAAFSVLGTDHFSGEKLEKVGSVLGAAYTAGLLAQSWARQKFESPEEAIRDLKKHLYSTSKARQWTGSGKILMGKPHWVVEFGWSDPESESPIHWQRRELRYWVPIFSSVPEPRLEKETEIWIEVPGAKELALHLRDFHHFSMPQTPESDRVEIFDEQDRLLYQLSGEFKDLVTPIFPVSRLRIRVNAPHAEDSSHVRGFELWRIYYRF